MTLGKPSCTPLLYGLLKFYLSYLPFPIKAFTCSTFLWPPQNTPILCGLCNMFIPYACSSHPPPHHPHPQPILLICNSSTNHLSNYVTSFMQPLLESTPIFHLLQQLFKKIPFLVPPHSPLLACSFKAFKHHSHIPPSISRR